MKGSAEMRGLFCSRFRPFGIVMPSCLWYLVFMAIGRLWKFFGNTRGMIILVVQLVVVLLFITLYSRYQSSDRCVSCHADKERMTRLGAPQFTMTREQVQKESRHPNTECRDCHLGNGLSDVPD